MSAVPDLAASYLSAYLYEHGLMSVTVEREPDGAYLVHGESFERRVPGPPAGSSVLLWALGSAEQIAHSLSDDDT